MHMQASACWDDIGEPWAQSVALSPVWSTDSRDYNETIMQPGLCTVKLDRGVKVEKPNKHEVETRYHAPSPASFPRLNTVKLNKEENCPRSEVSWFLCCD